MPYAHLGHLLRLIREQILPRGNFKVGIVALYQQHLAPGGFKNTAIVGAQWGDEGKGKLVDDLAQDFDYVLVDCPAGIEQGFKNAIAGADRAVVVTTPEVSAVRDADRIIGLLYAEGKPAPRLVVNRIRPHMVKKGDMMDIDDIVDILAIDLIGVIPEDEYIVVSTNRGEPAVTNPSSLAGKAYKNIVQRLMGEEVPFLKLEVPESFWGRFKKLFSH